MASLVGLGVDGMFTNFPDVLIGILRAAQGGRPAGRAGRQELA